MDVSAGALMRQRSVASIPSKFETILHEGGREKNAFWCRTHRFTYSDNEMPGAGQYHKSTNPEREAPSYLRNRARGRRPSTAAMLVKTTALRLGSQSLRKKPLPI